MILTEMRWGNHDMKLVGSLTQLHFFDELPRFGQKHITMILSCPYVKLLDLTDALMFTKREPTPFSSSSKEGPIVIQYMH